MSMHVLRRLRLPALWLPVLVTACGADTSGPAAVLPPLDDVGLAVRNLYQVHFGVDVRRPAIFGASTCAGAAYLTTVAYLPSGSASQREVYVMHTSLDGTEISKSYDDATLYSRTVDLLPAGTIKILTLVLAYPQTVTDSELPALIAAQATINQQHRDFAQRRGYAAPLVQFAFTNALAPGAQVADPRSLQGIAPVLADKGVSAFDYDVVAVINIDPARGEGGFAAIGSSLPAFIYMGNYSMWDVPPTDAGFQSIANAVYHHEMGHHWGWGHGWSPVCGTRPYDPFITSPLLYGWEDTDGDRIPEILDPTPYGRAP